MRLTVLTLASTAALALAAPTATVQKRADYCGQWDSQVTGTYTVYNNLWGQADATSGSQCTGVDGLSGSTLRWHTKWSWAGGAGHVKSYANVVTKISQKALSSVKSLPSTWTWTYTGSNIIANVAYDLFTSSSATGSAEYEIMIWLSGLGGAGPISATGSPIATVTLAGKSWKLYNGKNGQMNVYSFVAASDVKNFKGDLIEFVNYLTSKQGMPKSQILQSVGAGTEPFSGNDAVFTTSAYILSQS
ncbi:concanavalin A-like lectin/glucanase domain-containing protein [Ampelomyces quisqualis]|uniref:Concanavalin A-like lectin/glucanase domain-containing protein n=1 Tax=Ampelomyces quisqualis TaxID=50730 RepID=A0A6A5QG68_AMPQU|nr:concanavalin A-like lectin/glucanase domain-containing protein [Ampelomyces quisqualis]